MVIWSHNTSESRATKFTSFKLLFGEEAVLPEELQHKSPRVTFASPPEEEQLTKDLTEELKCEAVSNLHMYQVETARWRKKESQPPPNQYGRHGPRQKAKRKDGWQTSTQVVRPFPGHPINQTRRLSPTGHRRKPNPSHLEHR